MEPKVNYTIVGAFVIFLLAAITLTIIWLSSGLTLEQNKTYLIYMQESISGLNIDSQVEYNGVEVGNVQSIQLNKKNPQLVEVLISIKSSTPITRGTVATLSGRGVTGMVYIALKDKSTDLRPLVADPGQRYPIIKTAPSIYVRLETALRQFTTSFMQIANAMQGLLDKQNLNAFKSTLNNLQVITNHFANNTDKFDAILLNLEKASFEMTPFMQRGSSTLRQVQTQTIPAMNQLFSNINDAANNLSDVSAKLKDNPSVLIRGMERPPPGPGETK